MNIKKLKKDIISYIMGIYGTYFSSLDDDFINDIVRDIVETSNIDNGEYSVEDISIAFQRVSLGRMGNPDFEIYRRSER